MHIKRFFLFFVLSGFLHYKVDGMNKIHCWVRLVKGFAITKRKRQETEGWDSPQHHILPAGESGFSHPTLCSYKCKSILYSFVVTCTLQSHCFPNSTRLWPMNNINHRAAKPYYNPFCGFLGHYKKFDFTDRTSKQIDADILFDKEPSASELSGPHIMQRYPSQWLKSKLAW